MKMNGSKTAKVVMGIALALIATTSINAQHGYGMHPGRFYRSDSGLCAGSIPDLTDDQAKKITALKTTHQKEMVNYRNDLAIKRAELQKFKSADKPDVALVNKTIDEIGKLTTEMHKKQVSHELAVRDLLTEEQKAALNSRRGFRDFGEGRRIRDFDGPHDGPGMNRGRGYRM
ncbi:MAG: Spy/CpxP family protein refolding chaperone [Bacteroidales bacterium]|nr:Spy/CpxP family protein refolding chaperone [Bacteroidales bacterium]